MYSVEVGVSAWTSAEGIKAFARAAETANMAKGEISFGNEPFATVVRRWSWIKLRRCHVAKSLRGSTLTFLMVNPFVTASVLVCETTRRVSAKLFKLATPFLGRQFGIRGMDAKGYGTVDEKKKQVRCISYEYDRFAGRSYYTPYH